MTQGRLLAVSDLHVSYAQNRHLIERLQPTTDADMLLVAGDIGERVDDIKHILQTLADRFAAVTWAPGNHELWTHPDDPVQLRGADRYDHLVEFCRGIGVTTPEDRYPVWEGPDGPVRIVPMLVLYDYSFRPSRLSKDTWLAQAYEEGVVCTDEFFLHPDPYPSREAWCHARVAYTEERLAALDDEMPTVLVNHFPLIRELTDALYHQTFAQWCGTNLTADWHRRFGAVAVVYGHLHIPRVTYHDGVRFEEVSIGYPREWERRGL
ncbi:MAG: metallophosphoesterase, partial [Streptosporangiaceae bacterium]|nr:metallophosphoesterase [Streptosporangiaceae bacterium]